MNETDHELLTMMGRLGTRAWTPTPLQKSVAGWLYQMLYIEFITIDGYAVYEPSNAFADMVNTSPNRARLLDREYWNAAKAAGILRKHTLEAVAKMPPEHAALCIAQHLDPFEYMQMVGEGTPAEYAAEASQLALKNA